MAERTTDQKVFDEVSNHPTRYNAHPSGVECIDIVEHMPFNVGSAVKYLWRLGLKENENDINDLKKALWYVEREIQLRSPKQEVDDSILMAIAKQVTET